MRIVIVEYIDGRFEKLYVKECNNDKKEICMNCKYDYTCRLSLTREKSKINNINNQILTNKNE